MNTRILRRGLYGAAFAVVVASAAWGLSRSPSPAIQTAPPGPALGTVVTERPTLAPLVQKVSPAVVSITVDGRKVVNDNPMLEDPFFRRFFNVPDQQMEREFRSAGSGVIVDAAKGYLITNNHVVEDADKITVVLSDNRRFEAKVVGTDPDADIAVLQIPAQDLTAIPLGDSERLEVGDFVVAIGQPFGLRQTVTLGIVSAVGRSGLNLEGYEDFIQTDASINPGNSGGALVDLSGDLVGINTAIVGPSGGNVGIGFAIPINMVQNITNQLIAHGKVVRGQLGVLVQDLTPDVATAMKLEADGGAVVSRVYQGSAADRAGIKAGDVITALDSMAIHNGSDLRNKVGLKSPGERVDIDLVRDGKAQSITVRLQPQTDMTVQGGTVDARLEGVDFATAPADQAAGVDVLRIDRSSAAYRSGLRAGDVITGINRQPVDSVDDLIGVVSGSEGALLLDIRRGDSSLFLVLR
jgi:Do/DeqQ family serine protease